MHDADDPPVFRAIEGRVHIDRVSIGVCAQGDARAGNVDKIHLGNVGDRLEDVDVGHLGQAIKGGDCCALRVGQHGNAPYGAVFRGKTRCAVPAACEGIEIHLGEALFAGASVFHGTGAPQNEAAVTVCVAQNDIDILHVAYVCVLECAESAGDLLAQGGVVGVCRQARERPVGIQKSRGVRHAVV